MPRALLPDRPGRNLHPAGQPTKRLTVDEAAARREAQRKAIEDKIQEGEMAKQLLAEINAAEERDMEGEKPQRLSVAICKWAHNKVAEDSDGGEDFNFAEVDAMADSESQSDGEEPVLKGLGEMVSNKVSGQLNPESTR
jgi:hypothetical protein